MSSDSSRWTKTIERNKILTNLWKFCVSGTVTWFRKRSREKSWGVYALSAVSLWSLYRCLLSSVISAGYITRISGPISERRRGWVWKFFLSFFFFSPLPLPPFISFILLSKRRAQQRYRARMENNGHSNHGPSILALLICYRERVLS